MIASFTQEHIAAFQQNEPDAIHLLLRHQYREMVDYAAKLIGNKEDAEEITFSTFIKLVHLRQNMQSLADIRSFLLVTIRNACYDLLGSNEEVTARRQGYLSLSDLIPNIKNGRDSLKRADALIAIYDNISILPTHLNELFSLLFFNKISLNDAAGFLNTTIQEAQAQRNSIISFFQHNLTVILI